MKVRRYYAQNMKEGMLRVREELGPEAVIIQSRKVRARGLKGFFMPRRVEITAAVETSASRNRAAEPSLGEDGFGRRIQDELGELKKAIQNLVLRERSTGPAEEKGLPELERWRCFLHEQEVLDEILEMLFEDIQEKAVGGVQLADDIIALLLRKGLRRQIKTAPEKSAPLQVFVGPTGVGKTTTLAKLAARYALYQGEKVGIITVDHYRIGAVEQIRTYAEITGLPLEVVMTPKELRRALERLNGCQRILIDTAGRSTLNTMQVQELSAYTQNLPPAEIFLVVSATTKSRDLRLITESFRKMNYNRLIFTKLDETNTYGTILNGIYLTSLPAIYLTTGQSVPDDICLADVEKMSALILGEEEE